MAYMFVPTYLCVLSLFQPPHIFYLSAFSKTIPTTLP